MIDKVARGHNIDPADAGSNPLQAEREEFVYTGDKLLSNHWTTPMTSQMNRVLTYTE